MKENSNTNIDQSKIHTQFFVNKLITRNRKWQKIYTHKIKKKKNTKKENKSI